ncbi:MAG TPA: hypothetical protein VFU31_21135 [Candidatus Binatia bacterium]|nr:hypothetical protein [Candidatus Binatia bacterium]
MDYAVSCNAILGVRDSGKTVTAKGIAEQLLEAGIPIVVFDAVGKWRWMKVPGDGDRAKAFKVVVAGGRAPDLALDPHSVAEIVRSAVHEKIPLIIDLYDPKLSKHDWRKIVQQSIRIIHYEANGVAHVFLEEAAEYIPQKVIDGETYAEVEKLARMGGNASVGLTLINQRSQEVNKAVLDLSHNLILGCQIGNKAIEAVEKWVDRLSPETAEELTTSLPHLKSGECWVWVRERPDAPTREKIPMCRSFHPDRRTPEVVLQSVKPVDPDEFVQRLQTAIPKLIEEAKANDPSELKKMIAKLKRELASRPSETKEVPILSEKDLTALDRAVTLVDGMFAAIQCATDKAERSAQDVKALFDKLLPKLATVHSNPSRVTNKGVAVRSAATIVRRAPAAPAQSNGTLGNPERRVLAVLAQYEDCEIHKIALLSGYRVSGGFRNILSSLRTAGLIEGENTGLMRITREGLSHGPFESLPEPGEEFVTFWLNHPRLGSPEKRVLSALIDHPKGLTIEELADATDYTVSGGFRNILSTLRTANLLVGKNTQKMVAAPEFFG